MSTIVLFSVLSAAALVVVIPRLHRWNQARKFRRAQRNLQRAIAAFQGELGKQLIPAFQRAAEQISKIGKALLDAQDAPR